VAQLKRETVIADFDVDQDGEIRINTHHRINRNEWESLQKSVDTELIRLGYKKVPDMKAVPKEYVTMTTLKEQGWNRITVGTTIPGDVLNGKAVSECYKPIGPKDEVLRQPISGYYYVGSGMSKIGDLLWHKDGGAWVTCEAKDVPVANFHAVARKAGT
jgi:hypothetical protein